MIFAISMDYTVFLLSSAKEHWDRSHDPREATVGGLAHSGRVIFAAAAVMVAVFFTFALSGPLPPKEMGVILGVAVLLDAMLVRLVLLPVLLRAFGRTRGRCRARSTGCCPTSGSGTREGIRARPGRGLGSITDVEPIAATLATFVEHQRDDLRRGAVLARSCASHVNMLCA